MTVTPMLELPHILPSQAQKHVTHNEALERLDVLVQSVALGRAAVPPSAPVEGECWIVADDATGAFAGRDGVLARFRDGVWEFLPPRAGWRVWLDDEALLVAWSDDGWQPAVNRLPLLGVATSADSTSRLAVSSAASRFDHAGAGHQLKVNKAAAGDTASLLFQTGQSGRAEIGTAGSDELAVKVSTDGAVWRTAMQVDSASGRVAFPHGGVRELLAAPRILHVRTDGSDANDGLADNSGRAFATIQKAVDTALALDSGLSDVEILVAPGTYVGGVSVVGALPGSGDLILRGTGSTAADVVISAPGGNAISLHDGARLHVKKLTLLAAARGLDANNGAVLRFEDIDFDACGSTHIFAQNARANAVGNYRITGDAPYHVVAQTRSQVTISYATITMPSPRNFSGSFVFAISQAIVEAYSCIFVGSATGSTYYAGVAAIIYTGGGAAFPGNAPGGVDTGSYAIYL